MVMRMNANGDWEDDGTDGGEMPSGNYGGYTTGSSSNATNTESSSDSQGQYGSSTATGDGSYSGQDAITTLLQNALPYVGSSTLADNLGLKNVPSSVFDYADTTLRQPDVQPTEESMLDRIKKKFGDIADWGKANEKNPLLLAALTGIGGGFKDIQAREAAAKKQQYELEQMERKAQIQREQEAAVGNSIMGLRTPSLINMGRLKRKNGAPVFNPNGTVA